MIWRLKQWWKVKTCRHEWVRAKYQALVDHGWDYECTKCGSFTRF